MDEDGLYRNDNVQYLFNRMSTVTYMLRMCSAVTRFFGEVDYWKVLLKVPNSKVRAVRQTDADRHSANNRKCSPTLSVYSWAAGHVGILTVTHSHTHVCS